MEFINLSMNINDYFTNYLAAINATVLLIAFIIWKIYSIRNVPPGPWGLPIVGYLPILGKRQELTLTELRKKYGNIFSFQLGTRLVVVLNDYNAIKEALIKQGLIFYVRPSGMAMAVDDYEKGIAWDKTESYFHHRKFLINTLKDFGMGKRNLESQIQDEINKCLDHIAKSEGKPMDPQNALSKSTVNITSTLLLGERFEYDDPRLEFLIKLAAQYVHISGSLALRQYFPYLKYLPFSNMITNQTTVEDIKRSYDKFHTEIINAHQNNPSKTNRDYIDAYLAQRNKLIEENGTEGSFDMEYLLGTLKIMFIGGAETVATTIRWGMIYLTANPSVQAKMQAEIDAVIGMERPPSINDQANMNYTRATILEINRCASLTHLGLLHSNNKETTVLGYRIPKGSYIITNIRSTHYNEKAWKEPYLFKPERFLDENRDVIKSEQIISFGAGKRSCVGEVLGKMELFLFWTSLLQRFTFQPETYDPQTFQLIIGIARVPTAFTIRAVERENFRLRGYQSEE